MKHPYPVMLNLEDQPVLVVGGGSVAQRKVHSLLAAGASVVIISPDLTSELAELERRGEITVRRQPFDRQVWESVVVSSTTPFMLVVAATDNREVNERVFDAAQRLGIFVNVVDQPERSSFIAPSVVRRGKLVIAVSTGGASPSSARQIVKEIEQAYGDDYEIYLDFLSEVRLKIQSRVQDKPSRQMMFKQMLEWDVLGLIRSGAFGIWKAALFEELERKPDIETIKAFSGR